MCLLCVHGIRHKKVFYFLFLSFLFMACLYFVFSKVFPSILQAKWKKGLFFILKNKTMPMERKKNTPKWYMKYTHIVSESLKMYTLLFYFFFFSFYPSAPQFLSLSIHKNLISFRFCRNIHEFQIKSDISLLYCIRCVIHKYI